MKPKTKYHRLMLEEREEISRLLATGVTMRGVGRILKRYPSTISREVNQPHVDRKRYRAWAAQTRALQKRRMQGRKRKLDQYPNLKSYVLSKLKLYWSPEQIANHLRIDYPLDMSMRISKETIYAYVYVQPRGELKRQLIKALRREHKRRYRRNHRIGKQYRNIPDLVSIEERPKEAETRKIPGHWEGDLLIGKLKRTALGTLVERTTRLTLLARLNNHDHSSVAKAFARELAKLPKQIRKTLTFDRGPEMSSHQYLTEKTEIKVFFAHRKSPWERGTNENTNGLIRQFFPKGTDFSKVGLREIKKVEGRLNQRPRKILNWKTPEEVFSKLVLR